MAVTEAAARRAPAGGPTDLATRQLLGVWLVIAGDAVVVISLLFTYLYLRALGYTIVATNFRAPYNRGEIDLIGWDNGVLCFIEVKTRMSADFAPPSTAVDPDKRKHIRSVARQYLRRLPVDRPPPCRFDIVSIVLDTEGGNPDVSVHKGAFTWETGRPWKPWRRDFDDRRSWRRAR